KPHSPEGRTCGHNPLYGRVASSITANMNPDGKTPRGVSAIIFRQDHSRSQIDRAAMKAAKKIGLNPDVFYKLLVRRQFVRRYTLCKFQLDWTGAPRVEMNALNAAIEIARCVQ